MYLNYLIIGLGKLGKIHQSKILALVDGAVIKTVDLDPVSSDYQEVPSGWNNQNDVLVISTPTHTHLETVQRLKENYLRGKKIPLILIEKPIGQTASERRSILEILNTIANSVQTNSTEVFSNVTNEITQLVKSNKKIVKIIFKRTSLGQSHTEPLSDLIWHDFSILAETKIINSDNIDTIKNIYFTEKTKTAVQCSYSINESQKILIEHEALYVPILKDMERKCTFMFEGGVSYEFNFLKNNVSLNSKIITVLDESDKIMKLWDATFKHQTLESDHSHLCIVSKILESVEACG